MCGVFTSLPGVGDLRHRVVRCSDVWRPIGRFGARQLNPAEQDAGQIPLSSDAGTGLAWHCLLRDRVLMQLGI